MKIIGMLLFIIAAAHAAPDYYGAHSTEATLQFKATIRIDSERSLTLAELKAGGAKSKRVREVVDLQISHLMGHFQAKSFLKKFRHPGVLGENYQITWNKIEETDDAFLVSYSFKGKTNFHSDAFKSQAKVKVPINLPFDPKAIYALGMSRNLNRCTDKHYNSEGDFFYFWDPDMTGCPLKGDSENVLRLEGSLERLPNTQATWPEYDRLFLKDDLSIAVFLGYIDNSSARDIGAYTYRELRDALKDKGFELLSEDRGTSSLALLQGSVKNQLGQSQRVKINLMLTDTEISNEDDTFHSALIKAFKEADVVGYDGHSGLGANLSLALLPRFSFKDNYQVFFFNGCSSYPYFNGSYFNAKPGHSRNLDIITAGMPTLTSTSTANMLAFLNPFISGKTISWQHIMRGLEASNGSEGTYLMGVNGDEDNKFRPR